jgi:hypothetical protein
MGCAGTLSIYDLAWGIINGKRNKI